MKQNTQLNYKAVKKIFPGSFTKLRLPTDLIDLIEKKAKYMEGKEIFKTIKFLDDWNVKRTKIFEFYAKKNKKGVELIPFDIEK